MFNNKYIYIKKLKKVYTSKRNKEVTVFNDLNLNFEVGKISCIMGPSGCGKSTLINLISGYDIPTEGKIVLDNDEPLNQRDVGVVFQDNVLYPWKTVLQNIQFGLRMRGNSSNDSKKIAIEYLKYIHMVEFKDCYPNELSGGMQQKVSLLRTLLYNPNLIILDESFSALDTFTRLEMQDFFLEKQKKNKFTAIIITHDISEAIKLSHKIYFFSGSPTKCCKIIDLQTEKVNIDALNSYININNPIS